MALHNVRGQLNQVFQTQRGAFRKQPCPPFEPEQQQTCTAQREQQTSQDKLEGRPIRLLQLNVQGEIFAQLLLASCNSLEQSLQLAEAERKRLDQQHLVELGALSAAMAHELRNPLNIIAMAATAIDASSRAHIQQQLKRADRLIADLLNYAGKLQLHCAEVPLKALVQTVMQQQDWQGVHCQLDISAEQTVYADSYRLQQVLINLLDNALAFCRQQSDAQICLSTLQQGDQLRLYVHNNGPAITAGQQASLFQPFVSKRAGGSGLGLAIVRRIMQAHGGEVRHRTDLGWPVSFELEFNSPQDAKHD